MLEIILYLIFSLFLLAFIPFIIRTGPPFVPTHPKTVAQMVALAQIKEGTRVADLGSGDGRLLIAAAKLGAMAHGYEINPVLAVYSRWKISRAGFSDHALVYRNNFWQISLADYDVILLYGITHIMPRLEEKLLQELKPGARVVSNGFILPNWRPFDSVDNVHVYIK